MNFIAAVWMPLVNNYKPSQVRTAPPSGPTTNFEMVMGVMFVSFFFLIFVVPAIEANKAMKKN